MQLLFVSIAFAVTTELFEDIAGIALQGGGFQTVFFGWPFFWKLNQYISVDTVFSNTVTGSCSGGSWLANAIIHDKYVGGSFNDKSPDQFHHYLQGYYTAIDEVLIDPNRKPTAYEATVRGIFWAAQPVVMQTRLFNDKDDLTRNTGAYLVAVDPDPWTRYNQIITKYHSQTPIRNINLQWIVETTVIANLINGSDSYNFDYDAKYIPAFLEFSVGGHKTSPLDVNIVTNETRLHFYKHNKFDPIFNKSHWENEWIEIKNMENAILESQMLDVHNYAMGSSNALSALLSIVPGLSANAFQKFPTKVPIEDYLFGIIDCGRFDEVALVPVIAKLQVKGGTQKVLIIKTKSQPSEHSMQAFFSTSSTDWQTPDKRVFEGKWDPETLYDGEAFQIQTQETTTIQNPFYSIAAGRKFELVVVVANTWNYLFQVLTSRDNGTISSAAHKIFDDVDVMLHKI